MNIAIVLGVSIYTSPGVNCLPGCEKDADIFYNLLNNTDKYNEILFFNKEIRSADVKKQLTEFFSKYAKERGQINELLLYYSGHGKFLDNEFYYILSDFDKNRLNTTSIQNTEFDNWIRSIEPNLTIKIVDACHSGVTYIKEEDTFETYLKGTQSEFKKCYFLFSSYSDQSSYQTENLSDFTKSLISAVKNYDGEKLRYKDVIDYISDDFQANPHQKPFFVIQADMTEEFIHLHREIKDLLANEEILNEEKKELPDVVESEGKLQLLDIIRKDAERYCTKDDVMNVLDSIVRKHIVNYKHLGEIEPLYDIVISYDNFLENVPNLYVIGKYLKDNSNEYFAEITYRKEEYQTEVP